MSSAECHPPLTAYQAIATCGRHFSKHVPILRTIQGLPKVPDVRCLEVLELSNEAVSVRNEVAWTDDVEITVVIHPYGNLSEDLF